MAEAILAGKKVEKLAANKCSTLLAFPHAILSRLSENLFMGYRPRNAGDGDRQGEQPDKLCKQIHWPLDV